MASEVNYDDHSGRVFVAVGFAIGITCVAIALRLLARKMQKVPLGADDFVILPGAIFTIGTAITFIYSAQNGAGRHVKALHPDELNGFWKATYAGYQTYGLAVTLIKVSVLLFYRRIFSTAQFRLRTNIVGVLIIIWLFLNNFMAAFQCRPIKKAWLPLTPGKCIQPLGLIVGLAAGNAALDFVILALPVYAVSKLHMSLAKKISVLAIFMLGGLSVVIAVIRIYVVSTADAEDVTWFTGIESWTAVEPAIEVLSVSLPVMAPFLRGTKAVKELRATFRSLLPVWKKSNSLDGNDDGFRKINERNKMFDLENSGHAGSLAFATAERHTSQRSMDDTIPLHAIKVTDQVDIQ
ncbi:MAG: hypothetical protein Q9186_001467 [Xanthomendoza sp. 1 TL-2023]